MATAYDVAHSFILLDQQNDGEGISNLKLQKLAYYAQGFFLALFGKHLFAEPIEAWAHGPVVPALYHEYKQYGSDYVPIPDGFSFDAVTQDELILIQEVYEVFGQFSAWRLRNMTHEESPWIEHEEYADTIPEPELMEYFKTRIN